MFNKLMRLGDGIQWKSFSDLEARPSRGQRLIHGLHRFNLGLSRHIIAADKEYSDVAKNKEPKRDSRREIIGGVGGDRSTLC